MIRFNWDEFYMEQAVVYAHRATCNRLKVGCVIVREDNVSLSEGYNGSISGHEHCLDVGCLLNDEGRCIRTIHAEVNAVLNAMKKGVNISGGTAYVTAMPCENCSKTLAQSGIKRIVYLMPYENKYNKHFLEGIEVVEFGGVNRDELVEKINRINGKLV